MQTHRNAPRLFPPRRRDRRPGVRESTRPSLFLNLIHVDVLVVTASIPILVELDIVIYAFVSVPVTGVRPHLVLACTLISKDPQSPQVRERKRERERGEEKKKLNEKRR